jgi:dTDP-4-amino-4,6-dideoxygalactose transaminase
MRDAAVQTAVHYPPAHRLSFFRSKFPSVRLPRTEEFASRELTLPLHPQLEERHVKTVTTALAEALADGVSVGTC